MVLLPVTGHVEQPCATEWRNQMTSGSNLFFYRDCFFDGLNSAPAASKGFNTYLSESRAV